MSWNPLEDPVDYVEFASRRTPGIARVLGAGSPREWQERRGIGLSGARLAYRGLKLAKFVVRIVLVHQSDWDGWHAFKDVVARPPAGTRPRALDIVHPVLADCGIGSCVIEDLQAPEEVDETGTWAIEIKCIEHRAPTPAAAVVDGSAQSTVDPLELEAAAAARELHDAMGEDAALEAGL
jgi:hypothetical protein